jgi:hypothetical protein
VTNALNSDGRFASEIADFYDFLDDAKPAFFVTGSLTIVLRTDPPAPFGPAAVAQLVADWAGRRLNEAGASVSDSMLLATRLIVDAYRIGAVEHMRPKHFYRPFRTALLDLCPEAEREPLTAALDLMESKLPERFRIVSTADFAGEGLVTYRGERLSRDAAVEAGLADLAREVALSDAEFDETAVVVREALIGGKTPPPYSLLTRVLELATATFNRASVARAGRLFAILDEALAHPEITPARSKDARGTSRRRQLDDAVLARWVGDPERRSEAAPVVRYFSDFEPAHLVALIADERMLAQAQLLSGLVEVRGENVLPKVLELLSPASAPSPTAVLNLLNLLGRTGSCSEVDRVKAVQLAGRFVTSDTQTVRTTALAALRRLDGRGVTAAVLRALDARSYSSAALQQSDEILTHLDHVFELLLDLGVEQGIVAVAEMAAGVSDGGFRFGKTVRDLALRALAKHEGPVPPRAARVLADTLRTLAGRKFVLITGSLTLGVDSETCLQIVSALERADDPEARSALDLPTVRKLAARAKVLAG